MRKKTATKLIILLVMSCASQLIYASSCSGNRLIDHVNGRDMPKFLIDTDYVLTNPSSSSLSALRINVNERTGIITGSAPSAGTLYTNTQDVIFTIPGALSMSTYCVAGVCTIPAGTSFLGPGIVLERIPNDVAAAYPFTLNTPGSCSDTIDVAYPYTCSTTLSTPLITVSMGPNDSLNRPFTINTTCDQTLTKLTMNVTGFTNTTLPATLTLTSPGADTSNPDSFLMSCPKSASCSKTINVNIKSGTTMGRGQATLFIDTYGG